MVLCISITLGWSREAWAVTLVGGKITTNTTWTTAASPYEVTATIVISNSARLTIQPGVLVRFRSNTGLVVGRNQFALCEIDCLEIGRLVVQGTAAQPVRFTSKSGLSNDWKGVVFGPASGVGATTSSVTHLIVEKAGQPFSLGGGVAPFDASVSLLGTGAGFTWDHVTTRLTNGDGLELRSSQLVATSSTSTDNAGAGIRASASQLQLSVSTVSSNGVGLVIDTTTGSIAKNTIAGNAGNGVELGHALAPDAPLPTIESNTIAGNGGYAITFLVDQRPTIAVNTLSNNGQPGIRAFGGALTLPVRWVKQSGEVNYDVVGGSIRLTTNNAFTVDPGCVVRFASSTGLLVGDAGAFGVLRAQGTAASPVTFTSMSGLPGGWNGIFFSPGTNGLFAGTSLENVIIENGGQSYSPDPTEGPVSADVYLKGTGAFFTWTNVVVKKSSGVGILLRSAGLNATGGSASLNARSGIDAFETTLTLDGTDVSSNGEFGLFSVYVDGLIHDCRFAQNAQFGINLLGGGVVITGNQITDNGSFGVRYQINYAPYIFGNTLLDNAQPGVLADGTAVDEDTVWSPQMGEPFLTVTHDLHVIKSAELRIEAGLTVKFPSETGLIVGAFNETCAPGDQGCLTFMRGQLTVEGSALAPVVFTSTAAAPGTWRGIAFSPFSDAGVSSRLDYAIVENTGQPRLVRGTTPIAAALDLFQTSIVANNLTLANNSGEGIRSEQSSPIFRNTVVAFNGGAGLHALGGGAPQMSFGVLFSNGANDGWQPAASTLTADPLFVDLAAGNYAPLPGSPCIDSGTATGLPFLGAAPNRGAIE